MTTAAVAEAPTTMTKAPPPPPHPLWDREVQLERQMLCMGAEDVRKSVQQARDKGHFSTTSPARKLARDWLPGVAEGIKDWRRAALRARGAKPIALAYIQEADANLLALIAIREMLDAIGSERPRVTRTAYSIGHWAEHELKMVFWEATDPESFKSAQWYFTNEGATDDHRRKGNVVLANRRVADKWVAWPEEAQFRVGATLIEIIMQQTGLFSTAFEEPDGPTRSKRSLPIVLVPHDSLLGWLNQAFDVEEASRPHFAPTIIPPREWSSNKDGGYWTPYIPSRDLIRFKVQHQEQRAGAAAEYNALDMPDVYRAVNLVQEVPWRINGRVLDVVGVCWDLDMQIGGLPALSDRPLPPKPEDIDTNEEAERAWRRAARGVKRGNNTIFGRFKSAKSILLTALRYRNEDRFYFPHKLDFRGRMYSIPSGLSPQGQDLARGLLMFADSKPILKANQGDYWLALHVANMLDKDKLANSERLEWVHAHAADWLAVAADPVGRRDLWSNSKHPWQALAAILDWAGYLTEGDGYRSYLPITVDGTCNGLQHLTALIKDHKAAPLVNLLPADKPADIYASVAAVWQVELEDLARAGGETGQQADWVLSVWGGSIVRSATKRQVMVLPYGGTKEAFFKYTKDAILEVVGPPAADASKQHRTFRNVATGMASRLLFDICNRLLPGAMALMKWLQDCSKLVAEGNQPIYWVTPSGFVVRHFYGKQKEGLVEIKLNGKRVQLVIYRPTKDLDPAAQTRGVSPNFVHSLDAATLTLTVNSCPDHGVTHVTGIHDAYGTHAADMAKLASVLRQAFVDVHETEPVEVFWAGCKDILVGLYAAKGVDRAEAEKLAEEQRPPFPEIGTLDIRAVLGSPYFFS